METSIWWDCIFVRPDGSLKRGSISQDRGVALAEAIQNLQRRMGGNRRRVTIVIHNTADNVPFEIVDLLYYEYEREVC